MTTHTNSEFNSFLLWEITSRDTIDFKKIYVDVAGGDTLAGLVLSEILYWYLPDRNGHSKLRVNHDGQEWIACRRYEWWDRTRLTPRQSDRILGILESQGLIVTEIYKFDGDPTKHIRLVFDEFYRRWQHFIENPPQNPFLPNGEKEITESGNPILPNGENDITNPVSPVTEITTKTTDSNNTTTPPKRSVIINPRALSNGWVDPIPVGKQGQEETTPVRVPSELEERLARVTKSKANSEGVPVLPEYLYKKLNKPFKCSDGTLLPTPNQLYIERQDFAVWIEEKITYWIGLSEPTRDHLINLICNYEKSGWLSRCVEESRDSFDAPSTSNDDIFLTV